MFLIFSHLIRNAVSALKRLLLQPRNLGIATSLALLVVVASSLWNHSAAVRTATQQDAQNSSTTTQKLQNDSAQKSAQAQADTTQEPSQTSDSNSQSTTNATTNTQGTATTPTQSFSTAITHAGQVTPGTLITYNAAKNEKTYYGGDLTLSATSITISKSNAAVDDRTLTITSPDGQTLGTPSSPWDDKSPYFWIATDASNTKTSGTSFTMFVDFASNVPNGTYQLHLTSGRMAQTADGWRYDGFITITVVD